MKRIIFLTILLIALPLNAWATCESDLMGLGMPAALATKVCNPVGTLAVTGSISTTDGTNDLSITWSGNEPFIKAVQDISLNLGTNNVSQVVVNSAALRPYNDSGLSLGNATRVWSDLFVGDGTNDLQLDEDALTVSTDFTLKTNEADGSDDETVTIAGGGAASEDRGGWILIEGADFGGVGVGGSVKIMGGAGDATSDVVIGTNLDAADIVFMGGTTQDIKWHIDGANGTLTSAPGVEARFTTADTGTTDFVETCVTEAVDSAAGTQTVPSVIPAGAMVIGVTCRVDTVIVGAGAASFTLGDGTDADLFGTAIAFAEGTTVDSGDYTANPATTAFSASAADLTMTADAGQFDSGSITCCVQGFVSTAPTS